MKKTTETNFSCDFCNKSFARESTIAKHMCEKKRRWNEQDLPGNRIAFQSWLKFYAKNTANTKKRSYLDFIHSSYYLGFVKFGHYCVDIKCINVNRFVDWLLKNNKHLDKWASDTFYTEFIIDYERTEDPLDALARSIETTSEIAKEYGVPTHDCLRYVNRNKLCQEITAGRISPWMLYHSASGIQLIEDLDETQQKIILDYIDPEKWAIRFKRYTDSVTQVKDLLKQGGY